MPTATVLLSSRPVRRLITLAAGCLAISFLLAGASTSAFAQNVVERTAKGLPGKDVRIGLYINLEPDCTSGPLPVIRLIAKPAHGTVTIKRGKISGTNYKHCLALEVPGLVAFYRAKPDFLGVDVMMIEVRYRGMRTEVQRISVTVGSGSPAREI
jgi:hypothetical protein